MPELTISRKNTWLAVAHILWAIALIVPVVIFTFFPEQMIDNIFDWLLFELPDLENPLNWIVWVLLGIVNVLIFLAVMTVVLVFRLLAIPVMLLICLPSLVGAAGVLISKKWGLNVMLFSGIFSLVMIPFGTALGIWTILRYRKRSKESLPALVDENQFV